VPKTVFSDEYRIFRELMRELRIQKGMTQAELSSALGMAQSFVSKYEMGERRLDFVEVDKICEVLGFDLPNFVAAYYSRLHVSNKQAIKHGKRIRKS
jgi:transcriptional regulator with XRE-family HTH domain